MSRPMSWIVHVDLSTGKVEKKPVEEMTNSMFLGGSGVAGKLNAFALYLRIRDGDVDLMGPQGL